MIESLGQEVGSVPNSRDMRDANRLGPNKIVNEMPFDVYVFRSIMENGVVGQSYGVVGVAKRPWSHVPEIALH